MQVNATARALFRYVRPYRLHAVFALLALVFTSCAVLGMGGALRYLVDEGLGRGDTELLNRAYVMLLGVVALLAGATYARYYLVSWIGERAVADIRNDVYRRLVGLDIGFFERTRTGELLSRLTTDTTLIQNVIGSSLSLALRNALLLVGGFALLLITSAQLTGYVFLMVPAVVAPILLLGKKVRAMSREAQAKLGEMNAHAEESLSSIRTVQAMTMEAGEMLRFSERVNEAMGAALARIRLRAFLTALVISLVFGAVVTVLWVGGHAVANGEITSGQLSAFVFYSVVVAGAVGAIGEVMTELQRAGGAADRVSELLATLPAIAAPENPAKLDISVPARVTFEQVRFTYEARPDRAALNTVSLAVEPGEVVALVGPSGAGKTTLFQLLLRFYDPDSGAVRINGADIRTFDPQDLRAAIGLVPQEPALFSASAFDNIRFGNPEASEMDVLAAAKAASALEFLEKLPKGLHTHLGEKGIQLSGGQRQRLAIARALVRNPRILLLDEATSSLDAENEHFIQQALKVLMQGRTTLVIAHRLSTVLSANRIVLLNEGRIEAIGTHAELMKASPLYARLASLQLAA